DLPRNLWIAQRAVQRHSGHVGDLAGPLEMVLEEALHLGLDAAAGRRHRAALPFLRAEALENREQQAALAAEVALDQLLVHASRVRHLARGRGIVAAPGEYLHAGGEQRLLGRLLVTPPPGWGVLSHQVPRRVLL